MRDFDPNYKPNPVIARIGQKILKKKKKGKVLFLQSSAKWTRPQGWDFPGGGLDIGEGTYEGLEREVLEETELKVQNIIPVYTELKISGTDGSPVLMIGYKGETIEEDPVPNLSWEHESYKWLTLEEAQKKELPDFHLKMVTKALKNTILSDITST